MVICQTPFRVSFFGGGTDYPLWFREHGGAVLSTAINKYGYLSVRNLPPFFDYKHRIVYSKIELANSISEINHPAVRAVFDYLNVEDGLEIHYDGDIPARSGIGSSSSFTVGLLNAICTLRGQVTSKYALAEQAIHIEQNLIGETVGSQDQIAAAYGGFNFIHFLADGKFEVRPVIVPPTRLEELSGQILLFFTGFSRIAEVVAKSQIQSMGQNKQHLLRMMSMVGEAKEILESPGTELSEFGRLLHEAWQIKRSLSDKVSNLAIDDIYNKGMRNGAYGGKLLGAGGGGFLMFFAPPEAHPAIRSALGKLVEIPFDFDYGGSKVILYNPDILNQTSSIRQHRKTGS